MYNDPKYYNYIMIIYYYSCVDYNPALQNMSVYLLYIIVYVQLLFAIIVILYIMHDQIMTLYITIMPLLYIINMYGIGYFNVCVQ